VLIPQFHCRHVLCCSGCNHACSHFDSFFQAHHSNSALFPFPCLYICIVAHYCTPASPVKTPPFGSIPTPSASKTTPFPPQFTSKTSVLVKSSPSQSSKALSPETKVLPKAIVAIKPASGAHANSVYGVGGAAAEAASAASDDCTSSSENNFKNIKVLSLLLLNQIAPATMKLLFMYFV
jgi:hypothetical protein